MNSQISPREAGVSDVMRSSRGAEYKTLQDQIDEDAERLVQNERRRVEIRDKMRSLRDAAADLAKDTKETRTRRARNIERKRLVLKNNFDLLMIEEQ